MIGCGYWVFMIAPHKTRARLSTVPLMAIAETED
jgi:hypothetical protein